MEIVKTAADLKIVLHHVKLEKMTVGFVPTMGFLHEGHVGLIRKAREENDFVVVSIYVNPVQFGENEDFNKYPTDLKRDADLLEKIGVDLVFIPDDFEIYGMDFKSLLTGRFLTIVKPPQYLLDSFCAVFRPGHFEGVATVVCKFFNLILPNRAYFGQKDYQQLLVIKKMVKDLHLPVRIEMCPIFREPDGLAMSSRNVYLSEDLRESALVLYKALIKAKSLIESGFTFFKSDIGSVLSPAIHLIKADKKVELEYFDIKDAENLNSIECIEKNKIYILAGAIRLDGVRLIDNVLIEI